MQGRTLILKDKNTSEFDKEMAHLQIEDQTKPPPPENEKTKQNTNKKHIKAGIHIK